MSNLNISIGPDEQNPGAMKGVITYEFKVKLSEGEKFLEAVKDSNIIPLAVKKIYEAIEGMQRKVNEKEPSAPGPE